MKKTLVAWFSASGVTEKTAKALAKATDADTFAIRPKTPYTAADLDWRDKNSRSTVEMNDKSSRPEIEGGVDVSGYDVIYVGFPIWWYTAPRIINTFLESCDLSGKTVVLFATSGGSGLGKTADDLKESAKGAKIVTGKTLNGSPSQDELKKWADSLGL